MTDSIMWGEQVLDNDYAQIYIDLLNPCVMEVYSTGAILWIRCAINTKMGGFLLCNTRREVINLKDFSFPGLLHF